MSNYRLETLKIHNKDIFDEIKNILDYLEQNRPEYFEETLNAFINAIKSLKENPESRCLHTYYKYIKKVELFNSRNHRIPYNIVVLLSEKKKIVYLLICYHDHMNVDLSKIKIPKGINKKTLVEQKDLKLLDFLLMNWN